MNMTFKPGCRRGSVTVPSSKSVAHRLLLCAALSHKESKIKCNGISKDISATINCLTQLGASFSQNADGVIKVNPGELSNAELKQMYCGESGSTLRFILPVTAALGVKAVFHPEGRLSNRPMDEMYSQLEKNGALIERHGQSILCHGKLSGGVYSLPGNISSQYISGLLFALPLLSEDSRLEIKGKTESGSYIKLTEHALEQSGITFEKDEKGYSIPGNQTYSLQSPCAVEGDWSNAAFFLCMGAFSPKGITVSGLNRFSAQGDSCILQLLKQFGADVNVSANKVTVRKKQMRPLTVDASQIPDLVPVLSVLMLGADGISEIKNAGRLRLKESDRLTSTVNMMNSLGGNAAQTDDGIIIYGKGSLRGGTADPENDHRIAMSAAVASCLCREEVVVKNAECTEKSYPSFVNDFNSLEVM